MAYEIIKRLKQKGKTKLLKTLAGRVTEREKKKGQLYMLFKELFDAKGIY